MTEQLNVIEIYLAFLKGDLPLKEAASRLRQCAASGEIGVGILELDRLPDAQRTQAAISLDELTGATLQRSIAGDISPDVAAQQLAPFLLAHGVVALNLPELNGVDRRLAMSRFSELMECLTVIADRVATKHA